MKNIFVATSTRADYGLLKPVIQKIKQDKQLNLILAVTGTHLMSEFGNTIEEIEKDGFVASHKIEIMKFGNDDMAIVKTISYTIECFADILNKNRPDVVLLLGDRYEIFAVATASATLGIPIAHISGGDVTTGAKDDFYRHCITHMSKLHFPSCQDSYNRLLRLGENPKAVFNVGGLGDENIKNTVTLSLKQLSDSLEIDLSAPFALVTYHPETQKKSSPANEMKKLLSALDKVQNLNFIFTKSNADTGGVEINELIDAYCKKNQHKARAFFSLGMIRYLSAMKYCSVVIGNSSSGVVETPTFKTPCVNIGNRQNGRFLAENIIQTTGETADILQAIEKAVSTEFLLKSQTAKSPYYNNCIPSDEIIKHIKQFAGSQDTNKIFYDGEKQI